MNLFGPFHGWYGIASPMDPIPLVTFTIKLKHHLQQELKHPGFKKEPLINSKTYPKLIGRVFFIREESSLKMTVSSLKTKMFPEN